MMKATKSQKIKAFDDMPTCGVSSVATQVLANNTTIAYDLGEVKQYMFEHFPHDVADEWFGRVCYGLQPLTERLDAQEFDIKIIISR